MTRRTSRTTRLAVLAAPCVLAAALPLGCAPAGPEAAAGLQITVYETRPPSERAGEIDAKVLSAKADTPAVLLEMLGAFGPTRMLYHAYQPVSLASDSRITIGSRVPFVTNTRMTEGRQKINTVQYEHLGAIFQFTGEPVAGSGGKVLQVKLNAELALADQSDVELAAGVKAAVIRKVQLKHVGEVEVGCPVVLVTVDASGQQGAKPLAYVCRVVLGRLP